MRKALILFPLLVFFAFTSFAQTSIEFIPSGGYTFPDRVNFYNTYGKVDGAVNWGGSLMFNFNRGFGIELMYNRMDTKSGLYAYGSHSALTENNLGINYIMLGFVPSLDIPGSAVHPFFGALLGASVSSGVPTDYSSNTKFAWGAQLGTNIYMSPRFGLRIKAQLLSPADGVNGGAYFGSYGSGVEVSTNSSGIYQFSFNVGLIIGLGKILPVQQHRINNRPRSPRRFYYRYSPYPYY